MDFTKNKAGQNRTFFDAAGSTESMNKKRTPQEKYDIVVEFFSTDVTVAEICRKHNVSPTTFRRWRGMFLKGGEQALSTRVNVARNRAKEIEKLKHTIKEISMANDVLRKVIRE